MKSKTFILVLAAVGILTTCTNKKEQEATSISISGAFALYPLAQTWAEEYNKTHPDIKFNIQAGGAGKGLLDVLSGATDVGMFSREIGDEEKGKGIWWIALCKEAVLPTINAANPYIDIIRKRGLKKEEFKSIFIDQEPSAWDSLLSVSATEPNKINVYTRQDAAGSAESWASWFGQKQANLKGITVSGDSSLAEAIKKDRNAIGYLNSVFVFDIFTGEKYEGIDVVPIDMNGNGKIDNEEHFYDDLANFLEAVHSGKFPSPPARDLYFITKGRPQDPKILAFFKWALTDGQKFVHADGYVPLKTDFLQEQVKKVDPNVTYGY
jgi:phosphate transport system substrate-binding protein